MDLYIEKDITHEAKAAFEKFKRAGGWGTFVQYLDDQYGLKTVPYGTEPDLDGEHLPGYVSTNKAGAVRKVISRKLSPN